MGRQWRENGAVEFRVHVGTLELSICVFVYKCLEYANYQDERHRKSQAVHQALPKPAFERVLWYFSKWPILSSDA